MRGPAIEAGERGSGHVAQEQVIEPLPARKSDDEAADRSTPRSPGWPRVVLHVDMDMFYAAVEIREDPSLAGKPLIIGHPGRRGVVTTCSYEARVFGVRSAMPSVRAMALCPQAVWRPGRMSLYSEVSRSIRRLFDDVTPVVEPLSIDEAFLDLTGIAKDLEEGAAIARRLKERIRAQERITASAGVAPTKFLAKLASDLEKPDGLVVFPLEDVESRLWPLPVERLWGVGPRTAARLRGAGIETIGDVAAAGDEGLRRRVGVAGAAHLTALARGIDPRRVEPDREARSISEERTYLKDLRTAAAIERELLARSEGVARSLRKEGLRARTVHIKVRRGDFTTWTRSLTLERPTALAEEIFDAARTLYRERIRLGRHGARLLGVGASGLAPAGAGGPEQPGLFTEAGRRKAEAAAAAADAVVEKYGAKSLTRARLVRPGGTTPSRPSRAPGRRRRD